MDLGRRWPKRLFFAVGRYCFAGVGGPIVGRHAIRIGQTQATVIGFHYFDSIEVGSLVPKIKPVGCRVADRGFAAERCIIHGRMCWSATLFCGPGFVISGVRAVAAIYAAIVRTEEKR